MLIESNPKYKYSFIKQNNSFKRQKWRKLSFTRKKEKVQFLNTIDTVQLLRFQVQVMEYQVPGFII